MNCKRFTARTSREALTLVRQAFGEDAVVLSTKPCAEGVEVLAMAPESVQQLEDLLQGGDSDHLGHDVFDQLRGQLGHVFDQLLRLDASEQLGRVELHQV